MSCVDYCTESENRKAVSASVVYPRDRVAVWGLWLPLPSITREQRTAHHPPRKRSKLKMQSTLNYVSLAHHHKVKPS